MTAAEMVTDFKLKDADGPAKLETLMRALNAYLMSIGLQPEEYDFAVSPAIKYSDSKSGGRLPERYRWLVAFAIEGNSEGYYIHVAALDAASSAYHDLGFAKTYSADNAYAIAREAQRFVTAASWN